MNSDQAGKTAEEILIEYCGYQGYHDNDIDRGEALGAMEEYAAQFKQVEESDKEVQKLKNMWDCDKAALSELQGKLTEREKEIERLKKIIDDAYHQGRRDLHYGTQKAGLKKFKSENNLGD